MYNELGVEKGREQYVLMSEPVDTSKEDRERLVQVGPWPYPWRSFFPDGTLRPSCPWLPG